MNARAYYHLSLFLIFFFSSITFAQITDSGWPKSFSDGGDELLAYQPQVDDWKDGLTLSGKVAVQVLPKGVAEPMTGVLWFTADTVVNKTDRMVLIHNLQVTKSSFFEQDANKEKLAEDTAKRLVPTKAITISLDRILAQMEKTKTESAAVPVNNDPPQIFVSKTDAKLVLFDGEPLWHEIDGTALTFAVNTNWDIFFQPSTKTYFLLNDGYWLTSSDLSSSDWKPAESLPEDFNKIPKDDNWKDVTAAIPLKAYGQRPVPKLFISTKPAELIVIKGEPQLRPIPNTQISAVSNTESDLFFYEPDKNYYYLVAGRWFKSASLDGPWTFTTASLPADFSKIPESDAQGRVLASVPNTPQANDAVETAQIPQLATVKKNELTLTVVYDGEPQFKPIPGTSLAYAVNTQTIVIKVGDHYYALSNGVWFESSSAKGPWAVADKVPDEIYTIPPTSPVYNATYVKIYGVNPTTNEVTVGYTDGYMGAVISGGVVVFGTGYYYPPYYSMIRPFKPIYYPYFHTYGLNAYYSPYYGVFYRHGYAYGPYYGINGVAVYNPATGGYYRGASAYGPYQGARGFMAYNPTTGVYAAGYQRWTPYASWGRGVVSQGDKWARGGYYSGPTVTAGHLSTSAGTSVSAAKIKGGDLYVGKDGNVYKKQNGQWYQWNQGSWHPLNPPGDNKGLGSAAEGDRASQFQQQHGTLQNQQGDRASQFQQQHGTLQNQQGDRASQFQQQRQTEGSLQGPQAGNAQRMQDLNNQSNARLRGNATTENYQNWRSSGQNPRSMSGARTSGNIGAGNRTGMGRVQR